MGDKPGRVEEEMLADQLGFVNHVQSRLEDMDASTSYFTCYDIDLAPGTDTIVLRYQDQAGSVAANRLTYVFTLESDQTARWAAVADSRRKPCRK